PLPEGRQRWRTIRLRGGVLPNGENEPRQVARQGTEALRLPQPKAVNPPGAMRLWGYTLAVRLRAGTGSAPPLGEWINRRQATLSVVAPGPDAGIALVQGGPPPVGHISARASPPPM